MKKNLNKITSLTIISFLASFPIFVKAALDTTKTTTDFCSTLNKKTLGDIINFFSCTLIKSVIPLLFTLSIAGFIWGMIQFFLNPENEEKRKSGKSYMLWGLITLFVMISMWGLVGVLGTTFGVKPLLPQVSQ